MTPTATPARVFISFAHETVEHDGRVQALADRLREHGIDARTYLKELFPVEGWTLWMERQIREADFVVMVCTETYRRRAEGEEEEGKGGGAKWESMLIRNLFHQAGAVNRRFIPVVFRPEDRASVPLRFYDSTCFVLREFDLSDTGYEGLYRVLTGQPREEAALGKPVLLDRVSAAPDAAELLSRPWNVPAHNPFFTGRETVLNRVREELTRRGRAVLSGLGGVGKTQTAIQYAHAYRGEYSAVLWARADTPDALASDLGAIARLLDLPEKEAMGDALQWAVQRWLAHHPGWLLVLDNADAPEAVKPFLPPEGRGHVLLTSRAQVFDVLGIARPVDLGGLSPAEASRFLFERTGREDDGGPEADAARRLASELGFLPLALEQAGAFVAEYQARFQDYLSSYLRQRIALLEEKGPVVGDYPESVRTTWTINFRQVEEQSAPAAEVLRLSAFLGPDDIPLELLEQGAPFLGPVLAGTLGGDPLALDRTLRPLTRFSLVRRALAARTYSIHRLVQEALRGELDPQLQRLWAERAVAAMHHVFPGTTFGSWPQCDRLLPHARACADLIDRFGLVSESATTLLHRTGAYLRERGHPGEAQRLAERATAMGQAIDHPDVAVSLVSLAATLSSRGQYGPAEQALRRALAATRSVLSPDPARVATCLNNLGDVYRLQRRYAEALPLLQDALLMRIREHGEAHPVAARSHHDLGVLHLDQGWYAEAEPHLRRALEIREAELAPGDPDIARSLDSLARLYTALERFEEAEPLFRRALEIAAAALGDDHYRVGLILENLARLLRATGEEVEAADLAARAQEIRARSDFKEGTGVLPLHPPPHEP